VDDLRATKSEDVGLIDRAMSFQDFHVVMIYQRHRQMDRRTDRQLTCDSKQDRTLHCSASRGKIVSIQNAVDC